MKAPSIESLCQMVLARLANEPASVEEWEAIRRAMATATREAAKCRNAERRRANERLRLRVPRVPTERAAEPGSAEALAYARDYPGAEPWR